MNIKRRLPATPWEWIAERNERAAERIVGRIVQTALMFGDFPLSGRVGQVDGTREFSVLESPLHRLRDHIGDQRRYRDDDPHPRWYPRGV